MTKELIKKKFLELKNIKEDIEEDYNVFNYAYMNLKIDDYQNRMLNAIHTYEEIDNISVTDRIEYNEGEILFYGLYGSELCEDEDDCLLFAIDILEDENEVDNPYTYLGVLQAYRVTKKLNKMDINRNSSLQKKYYS